MSSSSAHPAPVLVFGMHNSGTSILAEVIHKGGVFMHANMSHHESRFFSMAINEELLMDDPVAWARLPLKPVEEIMERREEVVRIIEDDWLTTYTRDGYVAGSAWGFKDPRLCVLLPIYLDIYPRAKLVYIKRNLDDVASSLSRKRKQGVGILADRNHWKELGIAYTTRAESIIEKHGGCHLLTYEEFCREPQRVCEDLFSYLNIPLNTDLQKFLATGIYSLNSNIIS